MATPIIFPGPLPRCHAYGCVGLGINELSRGAFADGIALYSTRTKKVDQIREERRSDMEDKELKIHNACRKKNVYIMFNGDGNVDGNSNQQGDNMERVTTFKYLGAT